jgi:hypothetical protein
LSKALLQWVLTVFSLTKRRSAISRLLRPWAIRLRISNSRGGDAEDVELRLVEGQGGWRGGDEDFAEDGFPPGLGKLDAEPDAEGSKDNGDKGAIDFEGVLDDQELVL